MYIIMYISISFLWNFMYYISLRFILKFLFVSQIFYTFPTIVYNFFAYSSCDYKGNISETAIAYLQSFSRKFH